MQRDTKKRRKARPAVKGGSKRRAGAQKKAGTISLMASASDSSEVVDRILSYYRPIKKPVTLRLDADVIAWFKKDGKRYQTRINGALRQVMEREMKKG